MVPLATPSGLRVHSRLASPGSALSSTRWSGVAGGLGTGLHRRDLGHLCTQEVLAHLSQPGHILSGARCSDGMPSHLFLEEPELPLKRAGADNATAYTGHPLSLKSVGVVGTVRTSLILAADRSKALVCGVSRAETAPRVSRWQGEPKVPPRFLSTALLQAETSGSLATSYGCVAWAGPHEGCGRAKRTVLERPPP
eukprot:scaffold2157_cov376-Prasinococcus_capsulatus_cf.AAC.10